MRVRWYESCGVCRQFVGEYICGTDTTASSTSVELGSYTDLLEKGSDAFVVFALRQVKRCETVLQSNRERTCEEERFHKLE